MANRGYRVNHKKIKRIMSLLNIHGITPRGKYSSYKGDQNGACENLLLSKAVDGEGLILHSDQGWQYQMRFYREELKKRGIRQSMSRKGNCLDNSPMENFFGVMKNEMFYGHEYEFKSLDELEKAMRKYIEYYNNERITEKTKGLPPLAYRQQPFVQL